MPSSESHTSTGTGRGTVYGLPKMVCHCSVDARLMTSWKQPNSGRRYYCCPRSPKDDPCAMFEWAEAELCPRAKSLIPGLLKKCNGLEEKINALEEGKLRYEREIDLLKREKHLLEKANESLEQRNGSLMKKKNKKLYMVICVCIVVLGGVTKALIGRCGCGKTNFKQLQ